MTKDQFISDIILRLTKGKPSDDHEIERSQVAYWADLLFATTVRDLINNQLKANKGVDPFYITVEDCVKPKLKDVDCRDCQNNVYIELACKVLDLDRDKGILTVETEDGDWVDKATFQEAAQLAKLKFSKPSLKNIKYSRDDCKLYLYGLNSDNYILVQFKVVYIKDIPSLNDLEDDEDIPVTDDVLSFVADEVEKIGRRQIYQSAEDLENNAMQNLDAS